MDFVVFPQYFMVAEHTFRPPYYHRNYMSEFMGIIYGVYEAKLEGFMPGGGSLHNCMIPHGPDASSYEKAVTTSLSPIYQKETLAFMFESRYPCLPTRFALETKLLDKNYHRCWEGLRSNFRRKKK